MKQFIQPILALTLSLFFSFAAIAQEDYDPAFEAELNKKLTEIESATKDIIIQCLSNSSTEEEYHDCALSGFKALVDGGNDLAVISIIQYNIELENENKAYEWFVYLMESNSHPFIKQGAKEEFPKFAERYGDKTL